MSLDANERRARLWRDMGRLLERVVSTPVREGFLEECLDTLVELFSAQRGLVLQTNPEGLARVLAARGPKRDLTATERTEISKTVLKRAEDQGDCIVWHPPSMGMSESMVALTITAAIVAPLKAVAWRSAGDGARDREGSVLGFLYLDFRDVTKIIDEIDVEFVQAAASLVAVVLELSERLQVAREDLRQARARPDGGLDLPALDELLWPARMGAIRREVESALFGDSSILILGVSGTGKTVLARAIAEASGKKPIVRGVLGASDDLNTITSELFGHERGAFSGAIAKRVGLVELARGGTLILDEILNLPRHAQQLLLDFTQFGTYRPLGYEGVEPKRVKVRLIAVTNGDLDAAIAAGRFRGDLLYRLAAVTLRLPALRTRADEVPALAEGYLRRAAPDREITMSVALRRLLASPQLPWPGNVRQLEAAMQRALERAAAREPGTRQLTPAHFEPSDFGLSTAPAAQAVEADALAPSIAPDDLRGRWTGIQEERGKLDGQERELISAALTRFGGVLARAARELDVPRTSLVSRIQTLGLETATPGRPRRE